MATQEQIETMLKLFSNYHPDEIFKKVNENLVGVGAVLRYLYESTLPVTAGQISGFLRVSTARTAVLIKKMENKGLVIKETGGNDARVTLVSLSDLGVKTAERMKNDLYAQVGAVIDKVGMEKMTEFTDILKIIRSTVKCPDEDSMHIFEKENENCLK